MESPSRDASVDPDRGLVRAIGPWGLGANAVNLMIGAGIFALPAVVAAALGPAAVGAYLLCGVLIVLVLVCYVELGTRITRSGGTVAYIEEAFGPLAGFLAWAVYSVAFCAGSDAAIVHVLLDAVGIAVPALASGPARVAAMVLILAALAAFNVRGVRTGTGVSIATTGLKVGALLLLVVAGAFSVRGANLAWTGLPSSSSFSSATLRMFFAFSGAEAALSPSGEIRDPARTVPRGLLGGALVVVLLYVSIQVVAQGVLGGELAKGTATPLADVATRLFGAAGAGLIVAATAVSGLGSLAADFIGTPRTFLTVAEGGLLPRGLLAVHPRYRTPWIAILAYVAVILVLALSGGFEVMAVFASMALLLVYLVICFAAIKIRYTRPPLPGAFRAPGGPTIPLLGAGVVVWVLAQSTRKEVTAMAVFVGAAALYYFLRRRLFPERAER
jgi:amino acid transporter